VRDDFFDGPNSGVIRDLREYSPGAAVKTDVCVIGAGAAGITIARELAGAAQDVCLVEGGGLEYGFPDSQALYQGDSVGAPVSLIGGRLRFLGGSTNHWGGRCAALQDIDFRRRDWIPHSGWPFDKSELDPYYARARSVAGFSSNWLSDAETLAYLKDSVPGINSQRLKPFLWHYTPATPGNAGWNWGKAYKSVLQESPRTLALLHANFTAFSTSESGTHVQTAIVTAVNGISLTIAAKTFVLCCGGIENARLLLLGGERAPGTFGNRYDLVGRYFMQHPRGPIGVVASDHRLTRLQDQFNILRGADGLEVEVGLALSPQVQEAERLLNCSAVLQYQGDPDAGVTAAQDIWRSLKGGQWSPDVGEKVGRIAGDLGDVLTRLDHRLASGHSLDKEGAEGIPSRSAVLLADLEQVPDPDSRVTLGTQRDSLGLRQAHVDWRHGELERRTAERFCSYIAADFARLGIGRCRMEPWLLDARMPISDALNETFHHIGTTRMADDPREGVVDRNCAVHGMDNLYVAGSSVFPTSGQANPTFTIIALALRLADRLKS
jgi:choline dehydrogenase-like flavoprotein